MIPFPSVPAVAGSLIALRDTSRVHWSPARLPRSVTRRLASALLRWALTVATPKDIPTIILTIWLDATSILTAETILRILRVPMRDVGKQLTGTEIQEQHSFVGGETAVTLGPSRCLLGLEARVAGDIVLDAHERIWRPVFNQVWVQVLSDVLRSTL